MLFVYISAQGADKDFLLGTTLLLLAIFVLSIYQDKYVFIMLLNVGVEESPSPSTTLKCSLVRVRDSLPATKSVQEPGSGDGWLYPDIFTSKGSSRLGDSEYSLVCDSVQARPHSEEIRSLFSSSIALTTTLATVTTKSASWAWSDLRARNAKRKSATSSPTRNSTPAPEEVVEIKVVLNASQHALLRDSNSSARAALEAALTNEYLQTLNSSGRRTKRQAQSIVVAKVRKNGSYAYAVTVPVFIIPCNAAHR